MRWKKREKEFQHLLDALAVGGREPILDQDDWIEHLYGKSHLKSNGLVRLFVYALQAEWRTIDLPTNLCMDIFDHVSDYVRRQPGPWSTVLGHIQRVTGYTCHLSQQMNIDVELSCLAALFHDMGKLDEWDSGQPHAELGAIYAGELLRGQLENAKLAAIRDAILIHPDRPAMTQRIARVLHDADKLDKIGATGLIRRVSKAEDIDEAYEGAERSVYEAFDFPLPCLPVTEELLQTKLAFSRIIEPFVEF